ncbi:hypothetical protein JTB14_032265 [Gonioctena quinquepunctata]|nr:hypothetical protein JTB14_032265 [Gonioctena quinquepunctata]
MSGYDPYLDTFKSPSLALRWATVLKQLCDIAMFISSKKNEIAQNEEFATLKQMIDTRFDFMFQPTRIRIYLQKKWKKGSMLPLTEDVIKISKFIAKEEQKCAEELKCDPRDISKLRHLTELLLAHVILLNRKRSGEAQRITIKIIERGIN